MSEFLDGIRRFQRTVQVRSEAAFTNVVAAVQDSIQNGSSVTGAPGQPVVTGNLRTSWQSEMRSPTSAVVSTNVEYAPSIEDAVSYAHGGTPLTLRSEVGGFHSVALTVAGLPQLVASEVAKMEGQRD